MGEKRPRGDAAGEDGPATKRYKEAAGGGGRKHQPGFKKNTRRPESSNWAKKRARTIERRLRNPDSLPANVQTDLERELAALQRQIEGRRAKRQRAHMISKYHMLRFFERKKATRRRKQLQKRHAAATDAAEKAALAADLAVADIDVLYPQYFPFLEPYVSLYPQSNSSKQADGGEAGDHQADEKGTGADEDRPSAAQFFRGPRPPMWQEIKAAYDKGGIAALEAIQNRPSAKEGQAGKTAKTAKTAEEGKTSKSKGTTARRSADAGGDTPSRKRTGDSNAEEDADSESDDGGFFEDT